MGQQVEAAALLLVLSAFLVQALCSCACAALLYWVLTSNGTDPAVATLFAGVLACMCCSSGGTATSAARDSTLRNNRLA